MTEHWDLPWRFDAERRRLVSGRLRLVFLVAGLSFACMAVWDAMTFDHVLLESVLPIYAGTLLTLLTCTILTLPGMPRLTQVAAGAVGCVSITATVMWISSYIDMVPIHTYAFLMVGSATLIPWGVPAQIASVLVITATGFLNATWVSQLAVLPPTRERVALSMLAIGTVYLAHMLERQRRFGAFQAAERTRLLLELEQRVADRTAALASSNAALEAQAQERLRAYELLELLMDSVPAAIAYVDADRRYRWVNRRFASLAHCARSAIIGRSIDEFTAPAAALPAADVQAVFAGAERTFDITLGPPDALRTFDVALVPDQTPGDPPRGFFFLAQDVTDRRSREAGTRRSERLVALGTMAAGIAHEVNNPAASILTAADLAGSLLEGGDVAEARSLLRGIATEAERCGAIVRSILRFASDQSSVRTPQDLGALIDRAVGLSRGEAARCGAALHRRVPSVLPPVAINATEMLQVLMNLITNALRANAKNIHLEVARQGDHTAIVVRDDGCGMTTSEAAQIFDPFYSTRRAHGGSGLGLSVSHAIVTGHGGQIRVQTAPGAGTTMIVDLPTAASPDQRATVVPIRSARAGTPRR